MSKSALTKSSFDYDDEQLCTESVLLHQQNPPPSVSTLPKTNIHADSEIPGQIAAEICDLLDS
jgi:hypothetical protein